MKKDYLEEILEHSKSGDILVCKSQAKRIEFFSEERTYKVIEIDGFKYIKDDIGNLMLNSSSLFKIKEQEDKGDFPWVFDSGDILICVKEDNTSLYSFKIGEKYRLYELYNDRCSMFLIESGSLVINTYAKFKRAD
jgi:hypothetical protein